MDSNRVRTALQEHSVRCFDCLRQVDEYFEEFGLWKEYLKDEVQKLLNNEKSELVIPRTPAAFRKRTRRQLSVVKESDDADQEPMCKGTKKLAVAFEKLRTSKSNDNVQNDVVQNKIIVDIIPQNSIDKSSEEASEIQNSSQGEKVILKDIKIVLTRFSDRQSGKNSLGKRVSARRSSRLSQKQIDKVPNFHLNDSGNESSQNSKNLESSVFDAERKSESSVAEKRHISIPKPSVVLILDETSEQNSLINQGKDRDLSHALENVNHLEKHSGEKELQCGITIDGFNEDLTEKMEVNREDLMNKAKKSQASSAYYSMDNQNSSYVTASSPNETTASSSCRHSNINKMSADDPKQSFECNKTFKLPYKAAKSPYLFSPYANNSVKKRVAAFENLTAISSEIMKTNKRVTRSKARAMVVRAAEKNTSLMNRSRKSASHKGGQKSVKIALKRLGNKNHDSSKENSVFYSSKKTNLASGSKVLSDVNILSSNQSLLNSSKKTPVTGPRVLLTNICATGQTVKSATKLGTVLMGTETFIKKPVKQPLEDEMKRKEELEKLKEREKEALLRKEELLKKRADEQRKREERRLRVMQNREAKDKEKQESQLRVGKARDEKYETLRHERETKQREQVLKKRLEAEKKAAEARRKIEEAEALRAAKLKLEEEQRKKEQEELERERKRQVMEEKEDATQREKGLRKTMRDVTKGKSAAQSGKNVLVTSGQLDSTFIVPSSVAKKNLNSTFTFSPSKTVNNIFNLEELESGESDNDSDDEAQYKTAPWARTSLLCWESKLDQLFTDRMQIFTPKQFNISAIFSNKKTIKRTSSARWDTPPRYSCLPKY